MNKQLTRNRKYVGTEIRTVFANNLNLLMQTRYRDEPNKPGKLAEDARVALHTVQDLMKGTRGASIDYVELFAKVFGLSPYQMLMPGWLAGTAVPSQEPKLKREPLFRGRKQDTRIRSSVLARRK